MIKPFVNLVSQRRWLRFSIASLLMLCVPAAVGAIYYRDYLDKKPLDWRPYSEASLQQHLDSGKPAIVLIGAEWHATSTTAQQLAFADKHLKRTFRKNSVLMMYVDSGTRPLTPEFDRLFHLAFKDRDGSVVVPRFIIYLPGRAPTIFKPSPFEAANFIEAVEYKQKTQRKPHG